MSKTTLQMRLYPTSQQARLLMGHCQEYISTVNALVSAMDAEILPEKVSTKDYVAPLPSAVKNQALRDAQSVFKRSFELGCIPVLKKPICQWNNQNWKIEAGMLVIPMWLGTHTKQVHIRCAELPLVGEKGLLRIKKKREKWIADITMTLQEAPPTDGRGIMGVDLGVKVPAVAHVWGKGTRFFGNGRKNNRMQNTWSFYQLTTFITYKAERLGIRVEQVDPAYTSKECPACSARNTAQDRTYVCADCGWMGHRDKVGAINISYVVRA